MIPNIKIVKNAEFALPLRNNSNKDYAFGSDTINVTGLNGFNHIWESNYDITTGNVSIFRQDLPEVVHTILNISNARYVGFTFDQNMRPSICYSLGDDSYLYWYNSLISGFDTTYVPNAATPCIDLDDPRVIISNAVNDMVLGYIKENKLCIRYQRDRFLVEYELADLPIARRLRQIGLSKAYRYQFLVM